MAMSTILRTYVQRAAKNIPWSCLPFSEQPLGIWRKILRTYYLFILTQRTKLLFFVTTLSFLTFTLSGMCVEQKAHDVCAAKNAFLFKQHNKLFACDQWRLSLQCQRGNFSLPSSPLSFCPFPSLFLPLAVASLMQLEGLGNAMNSPIGV